MGKWVKGEAVSVPDSLQSAWREKVQCTLVGTAKCRIFWTRIFENAQQNGKGRMEEALLEGTVWKTRNSKSRQTLFAVLASRLMFWRWDCLEGRRIWLVSIDPLEKGASTERDGEIGHLEIEFHTGPHICLESKMMSNPCSWVTKNYTLLLDWETWREVLWGKDQEACFYSELRNKR